MKKIKKYLKNIHNTCYKYNTGMSFILGEKEISYRIDTGKLTDDLYITVTVRPKNSMRCFFQISYKPKKNIVTNLDINLFPSEEREYYFSFIENNLKEIEKHLKEHFKNFNS